MTAGRGRQKRRWLTEYNKGLYLTTLGTMTSRPLAWQIALVGGVAACLALRDLGIEAHIHFPNDVYLNRKKVCGILVETIPGNLQQVIPLVGIGINVNQPDAPYPAEVIATSLQEETGVAHEVDTVETALLTRLSAIWDLWEKGGLPALVALWNPLLEPDHCRDFTLDGRVLSCCIRQLHVSGHVTLELPDGSLRDVPAEQVLLAE